MMSSPRETHISDLLPAYALNSLDTDEARQVANHLQTCDECFMEYAQYQAVVDRLGLAAPRMRPSPTLKGRLLSRIQSKRSSRSSAEPGIPFWRRLSLPHLSTGWSVAASLIVVLAISNLWLIREVTRYAETALTSPAPTGQPFEEALRAIPLKNNSVRRAPQARGMLILSQDGQNGMLVVDGLPDLTDQQVFQAWLGELTRPTSAGIINVSDTGYGWVEVSGGGKPLHQYPYFGVTIEPAGGSLLPTGDNILAAYR